MLRLNKRRKLVLLGVFAALAVFLFILWRSAIEKNRQIPVGPFRIAGNLYYVGTTNVTSFLLTDPEGHVLIDGCYPETAPMIIESISKLGFNITDIKVLLNSHAHPDHAGGLAALQQASGAELWVSKADAHIIVAGGHGDPTFGPLKFVQFFGLGTFPAARVNHRFEDGTKVRVGPIELTAHVTAGHTPGCTSWSFHVQDGDRELLAVSIGSLTLMPFVSLVEPETYPGIRNDYERSFRTLRNLPADIFLASHTDWFNMQRKLRERADAKDPVEPFIDRDGYLNFIDRAEETFRKELENQQGTVKPGSQLHD